MLDVIPPSVLLALSAGIGLSVAPRLKAIPHWPLVLCCLVAAGLYGLGALLFVLGGEWKPGVAVASVGTLLLPGALLFALDGRPGPRGLLAATGLAAWLLIWIPALRPSDWSLRTSELTLALYLLLAGTTIALALRREHAPSLTRVGLLFLPLLGLALAYLLLKGDAARRPLASTCIQAAGMGTLLLLVGRQPQRDMPSTRANLALQAVLLAVGAVLLLVLAANLGLFPKEAGPLAVATLVATGLAVSYGALRPAFDLLVRRALAPEAARAETRALALQAELEATRGRLREAEHLSLVGQLAAQIAHEIKNPLGPIKGYTKVLEREAQKAGALNERVQRGLEIIRQEVEAIDERAQGLLRLARPPQPRLEQVDCVALGQDVLDLLAPDCPAHVRLGWAGGVAPAALVRLVDPVLLRSALLNAARNAVQALGARPGRVELGLRQAEGGRAELLVEDDGPGLPEEDPERLFRPFVSHRPGGNGLGLVISRGALRAMGGELRLEPREGGGARAVFTLPGDEPAPAASAAPEDAGEVGAADATAAAATNPEEVP